MRAMKIEQLKIVSSLRSSISEWRQPFYFFHQRIKNEVNLHALWKKVCYNEDVRVLIYETDVTYYENFLRRSKTDNDYQEMLYKSFNGKKVFKSVVELLVGISGLNSVTTSSGTGFRFSVGVPSGERFLLRHMWQNSQRTNNCLKQKRGIQKRKILYKWLPYNMIE